MPENEDLDGMTVEQIETLQMSLSEYESAYYSLTRDLAEVNQQLAYAESALDTTLYDRESALQLLARVVDPRGQDETLMQEIVDYLDEHPGYDHNDERIRREFPEAFDDAEEPELDLTGNWMKEVLGGTPD